MKNLGYLGPSGTFTEMAANEFLKEIKEPLVEKISYPDISELIQAVAEGEIYQAVVPIENSLEGSVNITLDYLAHKVSLKIGLEIVLPINQQLMTATGVDINDIKEIYSHPQALAQCREFLNSFNSGCQIKKVSSTAEAAQLINSNNGSPDITKAAIGSRLAAKLNELTIIEENIQDNDSNWTRFVLLVREKNYHTARDKPYFWPQKDFKTSIICSPIKNRPGILHEILAEFATRNINLTRIESRPTKKMLGDYLFFIDFAGQVGSKESQNVITNLKEKTSHLKILGSYQTLTCQQEKIAPGEVDDHEIK